MQPITLERYLNEPGLDLRLHAEARRARTALMGRLLQSLVERLMPWPRPMHWIARLGSSNPSYRIMHRKALP